MMRFSGTPRPQLSSCFLVAMEGDSIEGTPRTRTRPATHCFFSLPHHHRHLRHAQDVRPNLEDSGRHRHALQQHPCYGLIHLWHKRAEQRPRAHAQVPKKNEDLLPPASLIFLLSRVFNACARYVDQGGGKRPGMPHIPQHSNSFSVDFSPGAFAIYLEPWHADVEVAPLLLRVTCCLSLTHAGVPRAAQEPRQRGAQGA